MVRGYRKDGRPNGGHHRYIGKKHISAITGIPEYQIRKLGRAGLLPFPYVQHHDCGYIPYASFCLWYLAKQILDRF